MPIPSSLFHFSLPPQLIAQLPLPSRDLSRLFILHRSSRTTSHRPFFRDLIDFLRPGDLLVRNDSRVIPARLFGRKPGSGGKIEILLLEELARNCWKSMLKPGKRVRAGTKLVFQARQSTRTLEAVVEEKDEAGHCRLRFAGPEDLFQLLDEFGEMPLPPYVTRPACPDDRERYQTVYADAPGSVAAPTAGLHFTAELLERIREKGVEVQSVTLHVGLGTFAPVKTEWVESHVMHEERFSVPETTAERIEAARRDGRRVIAIGTTVVRVLESVAAEGAGQIRAGAGRTRIFIYPPFRFQVVDALVTNFHLPGSSLLMLVSAFASPGETSGRELILAAYREAIELGYRFFSYGDAMLLD